MSTSIEDHVERIAARLSGSRSERAPSPRVVVSPYRLCPIGAHVDHQGGPVLGTAIDIGTFLAFVPSGSSGSHIESANFDGAYAYDGNTPGPAPEGWGRYFWAAAQALATAFPSATQGIHARIEGALPGGGLSSSASVVLAYLTALAEVNDVTLSPVERVDLARRTENEFVGVQCGILDPASIVTSRAGHLVSIDTTLHRFEPVAPPADTAERGMFLVAYSGVERNLRHTGFNDRVAQCHEAARRLGELDGRPGAERLGDLPDAAFERHLEELSDPYRKRARHFFGERRRVLQGVEAWARGDLAAFGRRMTESCRSSIDNFEVGSPEIVELQRRIVDTDGVYGARFSGAGFGGCVVALVDTRRAEACRESIERAYRAAAPDRTSARVFLAQTRDGLHVR